MKEIVQEGAKVLRGKAKPVPKSLFGTEKLSLLIAEMAQALDIQPEGVALAAPQVGVPYRLFIVRKDRTLPLPDPDESGKIPARPELTPELEVYINPEIIKSSRRRKAADEGCLSVRGIYGTTKRHERVTIRAVREDGSVIERGAGGLLAQIFQHEIDHLEGILFIDHAKNLIKITEEQASHASA